MPVIEAVDENISDLFFNTDHHASYDHLGRFIAYDELEDEARYFLSYLQRLGIPTPTVEELIHDFNNRI